ncbi:MAG: HigA family addiction module antidote protein [Candidatus Pacebacteria bacterium]|nr:HigA family addiction module antidote protein [Candidatus Paceibacterota bacterium]
MSTKNKQNKKINNIHPGEILLEEFLKPLSLSQYRLAKEINVSALRINEIVHQKRAITADTALRLSRFFGNSAQFWLNLQTKFDLLNTEFKISDQISHKISPFNFVNDNL